MGDDEPPPSDAWRVGIPKTSGLVFIFVMFTVGGLVLSFSVFPAEWSVGRRIGGGLLLGYSSAFLLFANHLLMGE